MAPTTLEKLTSRRDVTETNLLRIQAKANNADIVPMTTVVIERHLKKIDEYVGELEIIQAEILIHTSQEDLQTHQTKYEFLCDLADEVHGILQQIKHNLNPPATPTGSVSSVNSVNSINLPKLELRHFDGNQSDWISFRDIFQSSIHDNPSIPRIQKLVYLKSLMKNEPLRLIQSITLTEANYDTAWQLLHDRYQNEREILFTSLRKLFSHSTSCSTSSSIRTLIDIAKETIRCLEILKLPLNAASEAIFLYAVVNKLDAGTRELWEQTLQGTHIPPFTELISFLEQRARALNVSGPSKPKQFKHEDVHKRVHTHHNQTGQMCKQCGQPFHPLYKCANFMKATPVDRNEMVKKSGACFNCLTEGHNTRQCPRLGRCKTCQQRHHTLLHRPSPQVDSEGTSTSSQPTVQSLHVSENKQSTSGILATAVVKVMGNCGVQHLCRAFLDSGSSVSFISERCANRLGLKKFPTTSEVYGLAAKSIGTSYSTTVIQFTAHFDDTKSFKANALVMPEVTTALPNQALFKSAPHLENLVLADPQWAKSAPVDILLGSDVFWDIISGSKVTGSSTQPFGVSSSLGWLVVGPSSHEKRQQIQVHHTTEQPLESLLRRFWELESVDTSSSNPSQSNVVEHHFQSTHRRDVDGRFIVSLPFKSSSPTFGASRDVAVRRLKSVERRLIKNPDLYKQYQEFMKEYEDLGHMTKVPIISNLSSNLPVYIPHHFVVREASLTTKLRVVFDASAKTANGVSLNDELQVGPTIQDPITDIVTRFRLYPVAVTADVAKMYRQIWIEPSHRCYQHILWRNHPNDEIQAFRLNTVTYGTASAPFLAVRALHQLAIENKTKLPLGSEVVLTSFYVDDLMKSFENDDKATAAYLELNELTNQGGMSLRKWTSNSPKFLEKIAKEFQDEPITHLLGEDDTSKTLGILWDRKEDVFKFHYKAEITSSISKRGILSSIAKLYDPVGWISPVIIQAKMLIQSLWKLQIPWDENVPNDVENRWLAIKDDLTHVCLLQLPRCMIPCKPDRIDLLGFCDASQKAYAAVVYLRVQHCDQVRVSIASSKTRVAPLKHTTLPRLELCAAQLLVTLLESVSNSLNIKINSYHGWSDSTITLAWIKSDPGRWKPFISNRVNSIVNSPLQISWHHVPGKMNPADCASRGMSAKELSSHSMWWEGPKFLYNKNFYQSINQTYDVDFSSVAEEERKHHQLVHHSQTSVTRVSELLTEKSDFMMIIRITAWCYRFVNNSRKLKQHGPLGVGEIQNSISWWIRSEQHKFFSHDISILKNKESLSPKSKLLPLKPFVDNTGILRVGGRLRNSVLPYSNKFPILLPTESRLTRLLVVHHHRKYFHAGPTLLTYLLQQQYWIIRMRDVVRHEIRKCVVCIKVKPKTENPLMGDLPSHRVTPSPAFNKCGVDYAGPFLIKSGLLRRSPCIKTYLALFVCFTTRAIHLEIVSSLSTEAFLAALRRFVARRGLPSDIFSDCGSNFIGANRKLKELFQLVCCKKHNNVVSDELLKHSIKWHFNPAHAPHFGGLWEAGVKSVKFHLSRIMDGTKLTFEELSTLTHQIEACLNSRPLTAMSSDPSDLEALTSGHFLIGRPLLALPEQDCTTVTRNRLKRWQLIQHMQQQFWKRWSQEFLTRLQQRTKWLQEKKSVKVNDLVIVKDNNMLTQKWKLGRITEVYPGSDDIVRVVSLKTQDGIIKRPVNKVCVLPINNDSESENMTSIL